jgi:ribonuclease HI
MVTTMAYTLYTDGSAIPNPGPCGCGAVMLDDKGDVVWTLSEYLGEGTNNVGELMAILRGCTRAFEVGVKKMVVYSDSELSVLLLTQEKTTKKEHLVYYVNRILKMLAKRPDVEVTFKWIKAHNNHKWNEMADRLANQAVAFTQRKEQRVVVEKQVVASVESSDKIMLKCPFAEKEDAKRLGARWDADRKAWWVADTTENRKKFSKWIK